MLTRIKFSLSAENDIQLHTNMSSLFHGYIMQNISYEYAEKMHISELRPFSQSVVREGNSFYWYISTLNDEAYTNISEKILSKDKIRLDNKDKEINIEPVETVQTTFEQIFEENYFGNSPQRTVKLDFLTPTAFKSNGRYVYMPDSNLILMGLIKKFDCFSELSKVNDEQLINEIYEKIYINSFKISSRYFSVESQKIPGWCGTVSLRVCGSDTLACFVNMLSDFAEFSGVGIKVALGMGQTRHIEKRCCQ
ncbi:MAG: CRISPR-associated endoribonuclease Cas6 [Acutalibacteraceae bacterium]